MFDLTNHFENPASNGTRKASVTYLRFAGSRNRGETIMNRIYKAAAAFMALIITLAGAAFVSAPMALADMRPVAIHQAMTAPCVQPNSSMATTALRHG